MESTFAAMTMFDRLGAHIIPREFVGHIEESDITLWDSFSSYLVSIPRNIMLLSRPHGSLSIGVYLSIKKK